MAFRVRTRESTRGQKKNEKIKSKDGQEEKTSSAASELRQCVAEGEAMEANRQRGDSNPCGQSPMDF
jgi:hypothetical protein